MKTKEYDEAIQYYNNSIKLDPEEATSYCNRALAYIKRMHYEKGLQDCNKAIEIKRDYSKAYYRRAVCLLGLQKFEESFEDLLFVLAGAPSSPEVIEELRNLKEKWCTKVGREQWAKIEVELDEKVDRAKDIKRKDAILKQTIDKESQRVNSKAMSNEDLKNNSFKKIKIVEDVLEDKNSISGELSKNKIFIT